VTLCSKYTRALTFENLCQALQPRERERERERETHPSPPLSTGGGGGGGGGGSRRKDSLADKHTSIPQPAPFRKACRRKDLLADKQNVYPSPAPFSEGVQVSRCPGPGEKIRSQTNKHVYPSAPRLSRKACRCPGVHGRGLAARCHVLIRACHSFGSFLCCCLITHLWMRVGIKAQQKLFAKPRKKHR